AGMECPDELVTARDARGVVEERRPAELPQAVPQPDGGPQGVSSEPLEIREDVGPGTERSRTDRLVVGQDNETAGHRRLAPEEPVRGVAVLRRDEVMDHRRGRRAPGPRHPVDAHTARDRTSLRRLTFGSAAFMIGSSCPPRPEPSPAVTPAPGAQRRVLEFAILTRGP